MTDPKSKINDALTAFLKEYGTEPMPQSASDFVYDPQIKNISLWLAEIIANSEVGTIVDIGCGDGILLLRLLALESFFKGKWVYFAADTSQHIQNVMNIAIEQKIHRRVEVRTLEEFYVAPIDRNDFKEPLIFLVRNVLHELDIQQTATLLQYLKNNMKEKDRCIIQDLQVFPVSERGHVCWQPYFLETALKEIGFTCQLVVEPTKSGNRWFTLSIKGIDKIDSSINNTKDIVYHARANQFKYWDDLGWLLPDDQFARELILAKLDFDLQCASLRKQLESYNPQAYQPLPQPKQAMIAKKLFNKFLNNYDIATISTLNTLPKPESFRDRASHQDWLEEFLRDGTNITTVYGGNYTGKSVLTQHVLYHRSHNKRPIYIDVLSTSSVWNLVEVFLSGISCKVPTEVLKHLGQISFSDISTEFLELIDRIGDKIILAIDHFERLLDPNGKIEDVEIANFFACLACNNQAKIIITSRKNPIFDFIEENQINNKIPSPVGRFPEGKHVINVLDDYIDRGRLGIDEYPKSLIEAIDRHPYLTYLCALVIRKRGQEALQDPEILSLVKNDLRTELLAKLVDPISRPVIEMLSLLRIPVPRSMLVNLTSENGVAETVESGLIYSFYDGCRNDLLSCIGAIRINPKNDDELEDQDLGLKETSLEITIHQRIITEYKKIYASDNDPRWLREIHFHSLASGDKQMISEFGSYYKAEIYWAGNFWFIRLKKYTEALWAFLVAKKLGMKSLTLNMRIAACYVRQNNPKGDQLYAELIEQYPQHNQIKNSYIDSLISIREFKLALNVLGQYGFNYNDSHWIAQEFGRCYLGVHEYIEAVKAFEVQIKLHPEAIAYDCLARAYHRLGDTPNVIRILESGLRRFKNNHRLMLNYASNLILINTDESKEKAEAILKKLTELHPTSGQVLRQYVKLLCHTDRTDYAASLWKENADRIYPLNYKVPISVEILIGEREWDKALNELQNIPKSDEHLVGMKLKVYLKWAHTEKNADVRKTIAKHGLDVEMAPELKNNIPIMITFAQLAKIAEDDVAYQFAFTQIEKINPSVTQHILDDTYNWDDDF